MRLRLGIAGTAVLIAAFALNLAPAAPAWATPGAAISKSDAPAGSNFRTLAKILPAARPLQCVPYARELSGILIRGDAWTWWDSAKGRYARGQEPQVGAVLTMKKTRRLRLGHLAVVKRVVDSRTIIVDQANWLNRGRIHLNSAVRDVSPKNDWSAVRVWYTPGARYGSRTYPIHGFIYPRSPVLRAPVFRPPTPKTHAIHQASLDRVPLPRRRPADSVPAQAARSGTNLTKIALADVPLPRPKPAMAANTDVGKPTASKGPRRPAFERRLGSFDFESNRG